MKISLKSYIKHFLELAKRIIASFAAIASFQAAGQTQQFDTIYVTDTFLRPGIREYSAPPSSGGSNNGEQSVTANEVRVQKCMNLRAVYAALSCSRKEVSAPSSAADLRIPSRYGETLLWESSALAFAQRLFNDRQLGSARTAAADAVSAGLIACVGIVSCQNDVLLYYGINRTSYGSLGTLGDINAIYNDLLRQVGLGGSLDTSDAGDVIKRYYGLDSCQGLRNLASNPQNRCGAL